MPIANIDCSPVHTLLQDSEPQTSSNVISTKYGSTLLEIQGDLNLPSHKPTCSLQELSPEDQAKMSNFITVDKIYEAIKFGHLEFDSKDESKVTLFIGKSQRLIGNIVKLDTPLGILKIPRKLHDDSDSDGMDVDEDIRMIDIIRAKMIFKQRPLPIM
ncbi:hypothetical protein KGF54_000891 [Candida jiufengensis]|uniref:uncharacterized protein n=1 Tax=Candida jiufengensis TaxID=497108 RepID=UPI0022256957|nr:uncharacterized protein KGF54_000891 [Candida jiufengensis]KAI5956416.1 hypothetical protein KGF54_000891 [Candida jiufengensis]